jgi:nucleoside-diphosphate-sugar epimerase
MARRIALVTGAGGFIGRWSVPRLLALGYDVHAVVGRTARPEIPAALHGATLHRADLLDPAATDVLLKLVKPSHLLHFAWIATPGLYGTSVQNYRWVVAGERLLHSFYAAGGVRAVMAGSSAEYDWARCGVCDEYRSPLAGSGTARAAGGTAAAATTGMAGAARAAGSASSAGTMGAAGSAGTMGAAGSAGTMGAAGSAGTMGAAGSAGTMGAAGAARTTGAAGSANKMGAAGAPGTTGAAGAAGTGDAVGGAATAAKAGSATPYAECKIAMQKALARFGKVHGMSTAWGRIFFQFGPDEHPDRLVAHVIISLLRGRNALCSHGRQIRSFLHVADVGSAFAALLDSEVEGPVNIGSGERISLAQLVEQVASQIGRPDLLRLGARSASPSEPALLVPEVQRLHTEVGWRPHFTLTAGIADSINWWRDKLASDGGVIVR